MYYRECTYCGAALDPGEICECQKQRANATPFENISIKSIDFRCDINYNNGVTESEVLRCHHAQEDPKPINLKTLDIVSELTQKQKPALQYTARSTTLQKARRSEKVYNGFWAENENSRGKFGDQPDYSMHQTHRGLDKSILSCLLSDCK